MNLAFSQAFNAPGPAGSGFGLERIGAFAYIGQRPTYYQTEDGNPLVGLGNKPFYRIGVAGDLSYKNLELLPLFMYGHDNPYLGIPGLPSTCGAAARYAGTHFLRRFPGSALLLQPTERSPRALRTGKRRTAGVQQHRNAAAAATATSPDIRSDTVGIQSCSAARELRSTGNTRASEPSARSR